MATRAKAHGLTEDSCHYAQAIDRAGTERLDRPVANDEAAINELIDDAGRHGRVAPVIDMPSSAAQQLPVAA